MQFETLKNTTFFGPWLSDSVLPFRLIYREIYRLTCFEIACYRIKYSRVLWLLELQTGVVERFRPRCVLWTAELQTANLAYFQRIIQLSELSAYLDGSLCHLITISAVLLYVVYMFWNEKHLPAVAQNTSLLYEHRLLSVTYNWILQHVWTRVTVRRPQLVMTSICHGCSFRLFI